MVGGPSGSPGWLPWLCTFAKHFLPQGPQALWLLHANAAPSAAVQTQCHHPHRCSAQSYSLARRTRHNYSPAELQRSLTLRGYLILLTGGCCFWTKAQGCLCSTVLALLPHYQGQSPACTMVRLTRYLRKTCTGKYKWEAFGSHFLLYLLLQLPWPQMPGASVLFHSYCFPLV